MPIIVDTKLDAVFENLVLIINWWEQIFSEELCVHMKLILELVWLWLLTFMQQIIQDEAYIAGL